MADTFDVIIIGGGPAGIFAALELSSDSSLKILIVEKGGSLKQRRCISKDRGMECAHCSPCAILADGGEPAPSVTES